MHFTRDSLYQVYLLTFQNYKIPLRAQLDVRTTERTGP
jgi:hypothetical protein